MQDLDTSRPGGRASGERDFAPFRPQGLPGDLSGHRVSSPWHRTGGGAVSPRPPSGRRLPDTALQRPHRGGYELCGEPWKHPALPTLLARLPDHYPDSTSDGPVTPALRSL